MLQTQTIEPGTLEILIKLMGYPELSNFLLVGGTALSLYYGHRKSDDIDLFSTQDFDTASLTKMLEKHFPDLVYKKPNNPLGLFGFIGNIKVDILKYHYYPLIGEPYVYNNIRLISIPDIMAMKVNAVMKRGVRKDFFDIAELLEHYSVDNFIDFMKKNIQTSN